MRWAKLHTKYFITPWKSYTVLHNLCKLHNACKIHGPFSCSIKKILHLTEKIYTGTTGGDKWGMLTNLILCAVCFLRRSYIAIALWPQPFFVIMCWGSAGPVCIETGCFGLLASLTYSFVWPSPRIRVTVCPSCWTRQTGVVRSRFVWRVADEMRNDNSCSWMKTVS